MAYRIAPQTGDSIAVPQLVFSRLPQLEDDWLRVALYVLSTGESSPEKIARALRLKSAEKARAALVYWKGAGLFEDTGPAAPGDIDTAPARPRTHLTRDEIAGVSMRDPNVAQLVQESQRLLGGVISPRETAALVTLYAEDKIPLEVILLGVSHCAGEGKRSVGYIEKMLLDWQSRGICTGELAEAHLAAQARHKAYEKEAAELLGMPDAKFTRAQSRAIASWHEELGFDRTMIAEAIAEAGDKKEIRYISGILRRWYTDGKRTLRDVISESATTMRNVQPASNPNARRILTGVPQRAPTFHKPEEG